MTLINQPGPKPTRKMWAVLIAAAIVGAVRAVLAVLLPDLDPGPAVEIVRPFIEGGLICLAGYMTRERAQ